MSRKFAFLSAGAVAAVLAAAPAMAGGRTNGGLPVPATPNVPLKEEFAQAAAYLGQGCSVIASKNISSVTHPAAGICCLKIGPTAVSPTAIPVVTVEWNLSVGVALFAQLDANPVSCPAKTIEVRNYKGDTGGVGSPLTTPVLSD